MIHSAVVLHPEIPYPKTPLENIMIARQILTLLFFAVSPLTAMAAQPLELASPFVDGAVLQRGMEVPVWGWVEPGGKVWMTPEAKRLHRFDAAGKAVRT